MLWRVLIATSSMGAIGLWTFVGNIAGEHPEQQLPTAVPQFAPTVVSAEDHLTRANKQEDILVTSAPPTPTLRASLETTVSALRAQTGAHPASAIPSPPLRMIGASASDEGAMPPPFGEAVRRLRAEAGTGSSKTKILPPPRMLGAEQADIPPEGKPPNLFESVNRLRNMAGANPSVRDTHFPFQR